MFEGSAQSEDNLQATFPGSGRGSAVRGCCLEGQAGPTFGWLGTMMAVQVLSVLRCAGFCAWGWVQGVDFVIAGCPHG